MSYCKADLRTFLEQVDSQILRVDKAVDPATQLAALCSETTQPTVFENISGYPDFRVTDRLPDPLP